MDTGVVEPITELHAAMTTIYSRPRRAIRIKRQLCEKMRENETYMNTTADSELHEEKSE